jgi:hypothetical protein
MRLPAGDRAFRNVPAQLQDEEMTIAPRELEKSEANGHVAQSTLEQVARRYAVAVSPTLLSLIDPADPTDPIARQFLPSLEELNTLPQERADPIGDHAHSRVAGIVHRHPDRVLFKAVAACPVYCRFCFRREMIGPGHENALSKDDFAAAIAYIADHPEIWEVILTGGDPFILSPRRIAEITARLSEIAHVKVVRWHTRVPVTDPGRVTDDLVAALQAPGATTFVAVHANHPREFSPEAKAALARLTEGSIPLISRADACLRREPHQALLSASSRSGAWHLAFPHRHRRGADVDARLARAVVGVGHAHLHARYPRGLRQGAAGIRRYRTDHAGLAYSRRTWAVAQLPGRLKRFPPHILSDDAPRPLSLLKNALTR